jgi:hypothetical protein
VLYRFAVGGGHYKRTRRTSAWGQLC